MRQSVRKSDKLEISHMLEIRYYSDLKCKHMHLWRFIRIVEGDAEAYVENVGLHI